MVGFSRKTYRLHRCSLTGIMQSNIYVQPFQQDMEIVIMNFECCSAGRMVGTGEACKSRIYDSLLKIRFLSDAGCAMAEKNPDNSSIAGACLILDEIDESLSLVFEHLDRCS
jgi:hypothetical protein